MMNIALFKVISIMIMLSLNIFKKPKYSCYKQVFKTCQSIFRSKLFIILIQLKNKTNLFHGRQIYCSSDILFYKLVRTCFLFWQQAQLTSSFSHPLFLTFNIFNILTIIEAHFIKWFLLI